MHHDYDHGEHNKHDRKGRAHLEQNAVWVDEQVQLPRLVVLLVGQDHEVTVGDDRGVHSHLV